MRRTPYTISLRFLLSMSIAAITRTDAVSAQTLRQQTTVPPSLPSQVISTNPFLPLWGLYQAEYERVIAPNASFAVASSYTKFDITSFVNFDAKLRLYPSERAPDGLGLAASVGIALVRNDLSRVSCPALPPPYVCDLGPSHVTAPTFAIEGGYQWLLGPRKATAITAGFGAKRYFASERQLQGTSRVVPTGRLSIGYAFR